MGSSEPRLELLTSKSYLELPSSLVHHPVSTSLPRIPVLTYIRLFYYVTLLLFSATASLPATPIKCSIQPLPNPTPCLPSLLVFRARVGSGLNECLKLQELHSWLVTHKMPCDSSRAMLHPCHAPVTHIVVRTHTLTHRPFNGAAGTPSTCSIHNYLNNLSESCRELD